MKLLEGDGWRHGKCRWCGLMLLANEGLRRFEHQAPVCDEFRAAATKAGGTELAPALRVVVPGDPGDLPS